MMQETNEKSGPTLWALTIALGVLLWVFTMTGGRQVFVKEMLGSAYDSQAEHFLRGDVNVDGEDIRHEALVVNGNARMYFGPFPAFVRMPLNFIYPAGRGKWSRISGFLAGVIALFAFAKLIAACLRSSCLSTSARSWLGSACLAGFALGSPLLLLLGNLSIYNEAIIWGLAWSLAALFFACKARAAEGYVLTCSLLGFSLCAAGALLSRVTFGLPFLLIAPLLILPLTRNERRRGLAAILLPLGIGLAFYLFLSYSRFGNLIGVNYDSYINPVHREFTHHHGIFNLSRILCGFVGYFNLHFPSFETEAPFLRGDRQASPCPSLYPLPFSETYLSISWCSSWLLLGATMGIALLLRASRTDWLQRGMAAAFFIQFILILSFCALAQRYAADLYPFLIFSMLVFVRTGGSALLRTRYVVIGLVALSIVVNSLTTISWLVDADQNVPPETRAAWSALLGRNSPASK
jgi:hypothetical protein